jgi:cyclopropane-fatty-acyl-phospholipid synthase
MSPTATSTLVAEHSTPVAEPGSSLLGWAERGLLPDALIRLGIRRLLAERLRSEGAGGIDAVQARLTRLVDGLAEGPLAVHTDDANAQHYEVPAAFYRLCLGTHLKYSSCLWEDGTRTLDEAEGRMLALTCARAGLADGQDILELGCGWGSLTLWMAARYPGSRITGVSNSHSQRNYILDQARARGLANVEIITCNIVSLSLEQRFDRVVSVECFEHLRNYQELFRRISTWLKPDGCVFVHVFTHLHFAYPFDTEGEDNWLGRHFFTGGLMPSDGLFLRFQDHLRVDQHWRVNGRHYGRTARAWLDNLDRNRAQAELALSDAGSPAQARLQVQRWRMFFMACEELWNYHDGNEWLVSHYRFTARTGSAPTPYQATAHP